MNFLCFFLGAFFANVEFFRGKDGERHFLGERVKILATVMKISS